MTVTNNYSLTLPLVGGDTNLWGGYLNNGVINVIDQVMGGNLAVSMTSSNVALTASQFQNAVYTITGTLTSNLNLTVPLSPNSATVACAGRFVVNNQTTGAFTITVLTVASGSTGVVVAQGYKSTLYSDGTNVVYADDQNRSTVVSVSGNPNGSVNGTAGSDNTVTSLRYDRSNGLLYVCTTTGTSWGGIASGNIQPQGYLTLNSSTSSVILQGSTTASTLYYSPYNGNLMPLSNGTFFTLIPFSQMSLALTASQAANNIYDVFAFLDGSTLRIGTGPSWLAGGGSITAGGCVRGASSGSSALSRLNGLWVNAVSMNVLNGASTYAVPVFQGTYLGSIFIDSTPGQITCHRSYGQSRTWSVWNAYNRLPIYLKAGDSTGSWSYTSGTIRPANGNSANSLTLFQGLSEEIIQVTTLQYAAGTSASGNLRGGYGYNSTTAFSGTTGAGGGYNNGSTPANYTNNSVVGGGTITPFLGINVLTLLETGSTAGTIWAGTETYMLLQAVWQA